MRIKWKRALGLFRKKYPSKDINIRNRDFGIVTVWLQNKVASQSLTRKVSLSCTHEPHLGLWNICLLTVFQLFCTNTSVPILNEFFSLCRGFIFYSKQHFERVGRLILFISKLSSLSNCSTIIPSYVLLTKTLAKTMWDKNKRMLKQWSVDITLRLYSLKFHSALRPKSRCLCPLKPIYWAVTKHASINKLL